MVESDFNAFLLIPSLDLDEQDEAVIEAAIRKMQGTWSKDRNKPKREIQDAAKANLKRLPEIQARLLNKDARAREAEAAKVLIEEARRAQKEAFEQEVEMLSKGRITDQSVTRLARRYRDAFFTEQDVRDLLARFTASTAAAERPSQVDAGNLPEPLEDSAMDDIRASLHVLGEKSLYTFLGLEPSTPLRDLQRATKATQEAQKGQKITREFEARDNLVGKCLAYFKDDAIRARYDRSLDLEILRPFLKLIDSCCHSGSVEIGHVITLIRRSDEFELDISQVLAYIQDRAERRGVPVRVDLGFSFQRPIQCSCGKSNSVTNERCKACTQALYFTCANCGSASPVDRLSCSCGHSFKEAFEALSAAVRVGDAEEACRCWRDEYRTHPAFRGLIENYDKLQRRQKEQADRARKRRETLEQIERAVGRDDDVALRQLWDPTLKTELASKPAITERIRQAHQPIDVRGVKARHRGGYIEITWDITDENPWYLVSFSTAGPVSVPSDGTTSRVTRGEYERQGFRIYNPDSVSYHVTVFTGTTFLGEELLSPGASRSARAVVKGTTDRACIHYTVCKKGFIRKRGCLTLIADRNLRNVPPLILVARRGPAFPTRREDGHVALRLDGLELQAGTPVDREFDITDLRSPTQFGLFTEVAREEATVDLRPQKSTTL